MITYLFFSKKITCRNDKPMTTMPKIEWTKLIIKPSDSSIHFQFKSAKMSKKAMTENKGTENINARWALNQNWT
jgi:hypothetical protein